ncbi:hypothetical protein OKW30_008010 [Paraburkholderia sp. Clong3]
MVYSDVVSLTVHCQRESSDEFRQKLCRFRYLSGDLRQGFAQY